MGLLIWIFNVLILTGGGLLDRFVDGYHGTRFVFRPVNVSQYFAFVQSVLYSSGKKNPWSPFNQINMLRMLRAIKKKEQC